MRRNVVPDTHQSNVIEIGSDSDFEDDRFMTAFLNLETLEDPAASSITYSPEGYGTGSLEADLGPVAPGYNLTTELITDPGVLSQLYLDKVLEVFPDVCRDHLTILYNAQVEIFGVERTAAANDALSQAVVMQILDSEKYPKESEKRKKLKRKRRATSDNEDEDDEYTAPGRSRATVKEIQEARHMLLCEFVKVPLRFIDFQLKESGNLYPAYHAIEAIERTYDEVTIPPYQRLAKPRKSRINMPELEPLGYGLPELQKELHAARKHREKEEAKLKRKQVADDADAALERECMETGNMVECQCCFADVPMPKATHCDEAHFFCLDCALRNAKVQIEQSRYELRCMDGSGCKAEFPRQQRQRFLDGKLQGVLERLQQQAELRIADLPNLESCPFCDYAAICPPVEQDREFRCKMPECEAVSCRMCKALSHLPITCEEYKKEQGVSERHIIEEAMTRALVKSCPKCQTSLLKDGGCNKMVCSKCRCCVCDYCGKDITKEGYGHFDNGVGMNPLARKKCPSTDTDYIRNKERIEQAEKDAMAKVRAENPDLSEDDLKIKFSVSVSGEPGLPPLPFHRGIAVPRPIPYQPNLHGIQRQRVLDRTQEQRRQMMAQAARRVAQAHAVPATTAATAEVAVPTYGPTPYNWAPDFNAPAAIGTPVDRFWNATHGNFENHHPYGGLYNGLAQLRGGGGDNMEGQAYIQHPQTGYTDGLTQNLTHVAAVNPYNALTYRRQPYFPYQNAGNQFMNTVNDNMGRSNGWPGPLLTEANLQAHLNLQDAEYLEF